MELLNSGQTYVRRWFQNTTKEDQVTVQFIQMIDVPTSGINSLVAKAQGYKNAGKNIVTSLLSFNKEVVTELLCDGDEYADGGFTDASGKITNDAKLASELFDGAEINIEVTENFEKNPQSPNQLPKSNPRTNQVVQAINPITGTLMDVYRHTELTAGGANNVFVKPATQLEIAAVSQELVTSNDRL